jgi:cation diffusion facilitator CzcD-associated flavoprotein CzcO
LRRADECTGSELWGDAVSGISDEPLPQHVEVAIVGAGFGGLGAAIEMQRAGFNDFAVLERAPEVGGTWFYNSYPGCQCDVPSNLYSYSFAPRADWPRSYSEQPEILEYLQDCSHKFGVRDRIYFNCEMRAARWDGDRRRWDIETSRGTLSARVLVGATGLLSEPRIPDIPGLEDFGGQIVHSARWGAGRDFTGQRVAVVGTGATAIQLVPHLQEQVAQLYVFQRTPPWVLPLLDRKVGRWLQRLYRAVPAIQDAARGLVYGLREPIVVPLAIAPKLTKILEGIARVQLRRQVPDGALRRRLTPDYVIGCKRILLSKRWYPAITSANVEVISEGLTGIQGSTLVGTGGARRDVDAIVFATGFTPTEPPIAHLVHGPGGRTLADAWAVKAEAYLGIAVAGFPNLFLLYGPNTNLAHTSMVYMLESQYRYLLNALRVMREQNLATLGVRPEVQRAFNREVQRKLTGTVWNSGRCASWYLDQSGENPIMWSGFTFRFRQQTSRFDLEDHAYTREGAEPSGHGGGADVRLGAG